MAILKFHRQQVIGPFIADFYCATARLVIEIDGDIHDYQAGSDEARTKHLEDYGYKIIRFRNEIVINDIDCVLEQIKIAALKRISNFIPLPSPDTWRREESLTPDHLREYKDIAGSPNPRGGESPLAPNSGEKAEG